MPIALRASDVLADLGVAVGHHTTFGVLVSGKDESDPRQFRPLGGGSEAVEVEQGSAVYHRVTDLDYALQAD
jgi:hypothetical protein